MTTNISSITGNNNANLQPNDTYPSEAKWGEFFKLNESTNLPRDRQAYTPLHVAAALGDLEQVKRLFEQSTNVNGSGNSPLTPLEFALFTYRKETTLWLFSRADKNEQIKCLGASIYLQSDIFLELYDAASLEVKNYTRDGLSWFHFLIMSVRFDLVKTLINRVDFDRRLASCAFPPQFIKLQEDKWLQCFGTGTTQEQQQILFSALHLNEKLFIMFWDKAHPDIKNGCVPFTEVTNYSFILPALLLGREEAILHLLDNGVDPRQITKERGTSLFEFSQLTNPPCSEKVRQKLMEKDQDFSNELRMCRKFGHTNSLRGKFFEGVSTGQCAMMLGSLAVTTQFYFKVYPQHASLINAPELLEILKRPLEETIDSFIPKSFNLSQSQGVFLPTGWADHVTATLFKKKVCVQIDTRSGVSGEYGGLRFYKIGRLDKDVIESTCRKLLENNIARCLSEDGEHYFQEVLPANLQLELIAYIHEEQTAGNCSWSAYKAAALAAMILQKCDTDNPSKQDIANAYYSVQSIYHNLGMWDRKTSIGLGLPYMRKYPKLFNVQDVCASVVQNLLEGSSHSHVEGILCKYIKEEPSLKSWKHPETGKTLLQYATDRKYADLLGLLIQTASTSHTN